MRVAYLTLDEVNQSLARELAEAVGAVLVPLDGRDPVPSGGEFDSVLWDLDYWPRPAPGQLPAGLLAGTHCRVAVHGYHLPKRQRKTLRSRGIRVCRTLNPKVMSWLAGRSGICSEMNGRRVDSCGHARMLSAAVREA